MGYAAGKPPSAAPSKFGTGDASVGARGALACAPVAEHAVLTRTKPSTGSHTGAAAPGEEFCAMPAELELHRAEHRPYLCDQRMNAPLKNGLFLSLPLRIVLKHAWMTTLYSLNTANTQPHQSLGQNFTTNVHRAQRDLAQNLDARVGRVERDFGEIELG